MTMRSSPTSRVTEGRPRVTMLTGCDPTAIYMIEALRSEGLLDDVIQVKWSPRKGRRQPLVARLARLRPARLIQRLERPLDRRRFEVLLRDASRELFGRDTPPAVDVSDTVEAATINGDDFARRLAERQPDILLVNGAPVLTENVFTVAKTSALNCHFGIAPRYRGSFTLFWPLLHRDYDHIGVTLHQLTRGLDAGPIVGQAFPALAPGDSEGTIMGKCARVATDLVLDYVEAARCGRVDGTPQPNGGRLYKKRDRTGLHDARLWLERMVGLAEVPARPPRRVLFLD